MKCNDIYFKVREAKIMEYILGQGSDFIWALITYELLIFLINWVIEILRRVYG
jgi:hypothetical protein